MMFPHKGFNWIGLDYTNAAIAQLGERQTEDLKVPGSIRVAASVRSVAAAYASQMFEGEGS